MMKAQKRVCNFPLEILIVSNQQWYRLSSFHWNTEKVNVVFKKIPDVKVTRRKLKDRILNWKNTFRGDWRRGGRVKETEEQKEHTIGSMWKEEEGKGSQSWGKEDVTKVEEKDADAGERGSVPVVINGLNWIFSRAAYCWLFVKDNDEQNFVRSRELIVNRESLCPGNRHCWISFGAL